MNEFGKICVVFVTAASLLFVAFTAAMRNGGRNWQLEADELGPDFTLTTTLGEKTSYSIAQRGGAQAWSSPVLAEAVAQARTKQIADARAEMTRLTEEAEKLKAVTEAALAANQADEAGLKERLTEGEDSLKSQWEALNQEISRINAQILEKANEAQKIRNEGQERREEVYRLRNQLELLRNDLYVAQVQRKNLEEEEIRLQEILRRLERRRQQLAGKTDYAETSESFSARQ